MCRNCCFKLCSTESPIQLPVHECRAVSFNFAMLELTWYNIDGNYEGQNYIITLLGNFSPIYDIDSFESWLGLEPQQQPECDIHWFPMISDCLSLPYGFGFHLRCCITIKLT